MQGWEIDANSEYIKPKMIVANNSNKGERTFDKGMCLCLHLYLYICGSVTFFHILYFVIP